MMTDDDGRRARNIRRGYVSSAVLGGIAVTMFVAAILLESGKLGGVGGVLLGTAVILLIATAAIHESF